MVMLKIKAWFKAKEITVYIVEGHEDNMGFEILGVFVDREKAELKASEARKIQGVYAFDYVQISCYGVFK